MFGRTSGVSAVVVGCVVLALALARTSSSAGPEARYVVRPGDTLWAIAATHYEGDPREAIWRIKDRNALPTSALIPGTVLALPAS